MTRAREAVEQTRQSLARDLSGRGLEIGALMYPMALPHASEVLYSDVLGPAELERSCPRSRHPDIISDSESFPTVADGAFDFIVANHVLEHLSSPLRALEEWHRILRRDGRLLMALPDKRFTFDHRRQRTPLAHLVSDYHSRLPPQELNKCHLLEWAEYVEGFAPGSAEFERWTTAQIAAGYSVRNHVWVAQDLFDALIWMNRHTKASFALEAWRNSSRVRGELVLLLRARKVADSGRPPDGGLRAARRRALVQHPFLQLAAAGTHIVTGLRRLRRRHH